ncbi:MAG: hypothetical protein EAZ55_09580 [Cytophagales bacterium]|nr:MAG: hypothetical protein EAZ55_09580 [Cytophagales bacterium]
MNNTKNLVEEIFDIQNKTVDNFISSTKKASEVVGQANAVEKAVEVYNKWFDQQQTITAEAFAKLKEQSGLNNAPVFFKEIVEAQEKLAVSWLELAKSLTRSKSIKEASDLLSANAKKAQEKWTEAYSEATKGFGKTTEMKMPTVEDTKETVKKVISMFEPVTALN